MKLLRLFAPLLLPVLLPGCTSSPSSDSAPTLPSLHQGAWHGTATLGGGARLPVSVDVLPDSAGRHRVLLRNGPEAFRLTVEAGPGDSLTLRHPIFEAALVGRATAGTFTGFWQKFDGTKPFRVPVTLRAGKPAVRPAKPAADFSGTWAVTFTDPADSSSYPAVGVFQQQGNAVTGTFLTTTGDYRYLTGEARRDSLKVSTFDGSHGWVFTARLQPDGGLAGDFRSGLTGHETWTARKDAAAKLPDANTLTGLRTGASTLDFKFPNIFQGGSVSPADPKYRGKVVIVQLLGTWCPNCMDETAYLAPWYQKNKARGVEIIGLGFEKTTDPAVAAKRLLRLRERFNITYDLAIAGYANKDSAARVLPALREVLAFPTTVFIGRDGRVKKVHTGFSGPGTGKYYEEWQREFAATVDALVRM